MNNEQLVIVRDGKAVADSRTVAKIFEKEHKHVLERINSLMDQLPSDFNALNFQCVDYTDAKGEKHPMYLLTRDAFTLAMGFTGPKALKFKLEYIKAFNAMEAALKAGDQTLHKAVEEGKASGHPVFDHVIEGAFSSRRPLTVDDFPCLIQVNGKRYIPIRCICTSVGFENWADSVPVSAYCRNKFSKQEYRLVNVPRYSLRCYSCYSTPTARMSTVYSYRMLAESCIKELIDVLNQKNAFLRAPVMTVDAPDNLRWMFEGGESSRPPRQPREPHTDSLADLPIGEILKLSGFELLKIFLKGLAAK